MLLAFSERYDELDVASSGQQLGGYDSHTGLAAGGKGVDLRAVCQQAPRASIDRDGSWLPAFV